MEQVTNIVVNWSAEGKWIECFSACLNQQNEWRWSNLLWSKLVVEQSSLIGRRRSKVSVDFAPPPSDGGRSAPELAHSIIIYWFSNSSNEKTNIQIIHKLMIISRWDDMFFGFTLMISLIKGPWGVEFQIYYYS